MINRACALCFAVEKVRGTPKIIPRSLSLDYMVNQATYSAQTQCLLGRGSIDSWLPNYRVASSQMKTAPIEPIEVGPHYEHLSCHC